MLEVVLMRSFLLLYLTDYETDDYVYGTDEIAVTDDESDNDSDDDAGRSYWSITAKFSRAEHRSFTVLSSVCCNWHQTLIGWPQSSTPAWLRHRIKKLIAREI